MLFYILEPTFESYINALESSVKGGRVPEKVILKGAAGSNFFAETLEFGSDGEKCRKYLKYISEQCGKEVVRQIYYVYLSEDLSIFGSVVKFLEAGFRYGSKVIEREDLDCVVSVRRMSRRVGSETHRLKGLIRFRELRDGTFYAPIEPDHNILPLLAVHFMDRFGSMSWVIHDIVRSSALVYRGGECDIFEVSESVPELLRGGESDRYSESEVQFQSFWREYFRAIGIEGRRDKRLQRQFMPKKYWRFLVEKNSI